MGKYNDIWTRVKWFEETKKTRKKKSREEKIKEVECSTIGEGVVVSDAVDVEEISSFGSTIDYRRSNNFFTAEPFCHMCF